MATSRDTIVEKLRWMWETAAKDYLKTQLTNKAATLSGKQKQEISSLYTEAFSWVKKPDSNTMNTLTWAPVWVIPTPQPVIQSIQNAQPVITPMQSPTTNTIDWITINTTWSTDIDKFWITSGQKQALTTYLKNLQKSWTPVAEISTLGKSYLKDLQWRNTNTSTYWAHDGANPVSVRTDPTLAKDSIENFIDLNSNGIPDTQEKTNTPVLDTNFTEKYKVPVKDLNEVEGKFLQYQGDITNYEIGLQKEYQDKLSKVQNENARRVIENNTNRQSEINALLGEQLNQNKNVYNEAVWDVYRQLGWQTKQFQRIIGSDGKAIDDATMLALMGNVWVSAMSKVVDLKNDLAQQYIRSKEASQNNIFQLERDKVITANERDAALATLETQTEENILKLTKNFYWTLFGTVDAATTRGKQEELTTQNTLMSYLDSVGLTPEQRARVFNQYSSRGIAPENILIEVLNDVADWSNNITQFLTANQQAEAERLALARAQELQDTILKIQASKTK
jgi:hypothetical protein